ncbi:porin [Chromobacterium phragmitis]|uniref:Porin n=1 Tax=Chromobacterium phragmitis TaxID=2202141 RepID=A0ABV0IT54_9NEIS
MKKIALVAAIAAAIPAFAQADVNIYGSLRAGVSVTKNSDNNYGSTFGVDDFGSRIGFRGKEDLGNGLKTIWQVETGFTVDGAGGTGTASGTLANRQSFVGLEGGFGTVRVGYINDVIGDTEATDNLYGPRRDSMGAGFPLYEATDVFGAYGDSRFKNSVRYDSPDFYGFNASAQYGAGESRAAGQMKQGEKYGVRLGYQNSGFFGAWVYSSQLNTGANKNSTINRIEGGYTSDSLYLAATYQWVTLYGNASALPGTANLSPVINTGVNKLENTAWALNAAYTIGKFKPSIVYSKRDNAKVDGTRYTLGASQWALGLDYTLSKSTLLEAGYGQVKENRDAQTINGHAKDTSSIYWAMIKHNF